MQHLISVKIWFLQGAFWSDIQYSKELNIENYEPYIQNSSQNVSVPRKNEDTNFRQMMSRLYLSAKFTFG